MLWLRVFMPAGISLVGNLDPAKSIAQQLLEQQCLLSSDPCQDLCRGLFKLVLVVFFLMSASIARVERSVHCTAFTISKPACMCNPISEESRFTNIRLWATN